MKRTISLLISVMLLTPVSFAQQLEAGSVLMAESSHAKESLPSHNLTTSDLLLKAYGLFDTTLNKNEIKKAVKKQLHISAIEDEYGLWLESANGYYITFHGIQPEVSSRVGFDSNNELTEYGYFFIFPYETDRRDDANAEQASFTSMMLQDMLEMDITMGVDELSDAIFEVAAEYQENIINVRLVEEHDTENDSGRFILILNICPQNSPADYIKD